MPGVAISFCDEAFSLLPCGALWWPAQAALLVADLHLEKGSAFARRGWLLPPYDSQDTLERLAAAVAATGARQLFALGDSFHDIGGPERLSEPARTRLDALMRACAVVWITGNHDDDSALHLGGTAAAELAIGGLVLRHEAEPQEVRGEISGHFHPKITLALRTGRRVSRRCIAATARKLVLPAYGAYAGGLDITDPAFVDALGEPPGALLAASGKLIRINARQEHMA